MNHRFVALLLIIAVFIAGCSNNSSSSGSTSPGASGPLRVGIIPFEKPATIMAAYQPFADYLGSKVGGRPGTVSVTLDYAGTLQALKSDQIDVAYLNPLSYVIAAKEFAGSPEQLVPMAMPYFHGSPTYRGIIFVRADSGINSMKDFKGKSFAFGDVTSTSGYLYPAGLMIEAGVDPDKDVKAAHITGVGGVLAVLNHEADGGATFEGGIALAVPEAEQKQLKVIATTDPIPNGMFVARGNLDPATLAQLQQAFNQMNTDPAGQAALKKMEYDKLVPANDAFFNSVRDKANALHLQIGSLDQK